MGVGGIPSSSDQTDVTSARRGPPGFLPLGLPAAQPHKDPAALIIFWVGGGGWSSVLALSWSKVRKPFGLGNFPELSSLAQARCPPIRQPLLSPLSFPAPHRPPTSQISRQKVLEEQPPPCHTPCAESKQRPAFAAPAPHSSTSARREIEVGRGGTDIRTKLPNLGGPGAGQKTTHESTAKVTSVMARQSTDSEQPM